MLSVSTRMTKVLEASGDRSAAQAYAANAVLVEKRLKEIQVLLGKHAEAAAKKPLSWGYPGDLAYFVEQLDNLIEHLK